MKIPNFRTAKGAELYSMTAGHRIAPLVAEALGEDVAAALRAQSANGRLLDVACGPGTLALRLAREVPDLQITGVDASAEMVKNATARATEAGLGQRVRFAVMDAHDLTFAAGLFDAATCNLGFPFFARPVAALTEIGRVLRPGAPFWASVPDRESWHEFFAVAYEALPDAERLLRPFMAKLEQAERLLPALMEAGFLVAETERLRLPFAFADGHEAIAFFNQLFSLFATLPAPIEERLSRALDERFPQGVMTAYVALLVRAQWVAEGASEVPSPVA